MEDYSTLFSGMDMVYYEESIREAVEQRNSDDGGNLMPYFDEKRNLRVKEKVISAIPSVEIRDGKLMGCTTVKLRGPLTEPEMQDHPFFQKVHVRVEPLFRPKRKGTELRSLAGTVERRKNSNIM